MAVKKVATLQRFENGNFFGEIGRANRSVLIMRKGLITRKGQEEITFPYADIPDLIELLTAMHGEAADMEGEK